MIITLDSFQHYDLEDDGKHIGSQGIAIWDGEGAYNDRALKLATNGRIFYKASDIDSVIVNFRARFIRAEQESTAIVRFNYDDSTRAFIKKSPLSNKLVLVRDFTEIARSTQSLLYDIPYYIEIKYVCHNVNGSCHIKVNGETFINFTGNTAHLFDTFGDLINNVEIGGSYNSIYFNDFSMFSLSGSYNNDFIGDHRVEYQEPETEHYNYGWDVSSSNPTTVVAAVSDTFPDYFDSCITAMNSSQEKIVFDMTALTTHAPDVAGIQHVVNARKTGPGQLEGVFLIRKKSDPEWTITNGASFNPSQAFSYHAVPKDRYTNGDVLVDGDYAYGFMRW